MQLDMYGLPRMFWHNDVTEYEELLYQCRTIIIA